MTERILVVGPSWIGDMVMAQSLFKTLKLKFPDSIIDVLAPEWSRPIISRMPEIQETISIPISHGELGIWRRYRIGCSLRHKQYSHAIILPRSFKAALVPFFARIPVRTGYLGEFRYGLINDCRPLNKKLLTQTVQRYTALGLDRSVNILPEIIYPTLNIDLENQNNLLSSLNLSKEKSIVAFMPGAEYGPAKCWPTEYFCELALKLVDAGRQVWVFGSKKEINMGEMIQKVSPQNISNLCGKTELKDVIDLMACADISVTNDSGLMHVACAVDVKTYAIYGSSSYEYTPPLNRSAEVIVSKQPCSPCFKRTCKYDHYDCLRKIRPEAVLNKIIN